MNTGETIALIKAFAWAADSNLFLVTITNQTADKTRSEIVDAINQGKTVVCQKSTNVYAYSFYDEYNVYFVGKASNNQNNWLRYISIASNGSATETPYYLLPSVTNPTDNGSELIAKNGKWTKQQKKFVVTLTPTALDYSGTMDKTVAQMTEAYNAGMQIVWRVIMASNQYVDVNVTAVLTNTDYDYPSFNAFVIEINAGVLVYAHIPVTNDGTTQTYSTTVYSLTPAS